MKSILRTVVAVIVGLIVGSTINMLIVTYGPALIPLPEGINPANIESLKQGMSRFAWWHFITPFLAHAMGTLAGVIVAVKIAPIHASVSAGVVASLFFLGGLSMVFMLPSPIWFTILDLIFAYIPMGYLGLKIAHR